MGFSRKKFRRNLGAGFTIIELSIATAVFATVLLIGLTSFIGIGKIYYKGVGLTQTQAVAQQILNQVTSDIQFAPTIVTKSDTETGIDAGNGTSKYICFGNVRYTFNLYKKVTLQAHDNLTEFGLIRDVLPGSLTCGPPFGIGSLALVDPVELLGNKMRLAKFDITPAKDVSGNDIKDLWNLNVKVAYGDDEVLQNPGDANVACDSSLNTSQFCSVFEQNATVSRGFGL